jgi:hypothetical protein
MAPNIADVPEYVLTNIGSLRKQDATGKGSCQTRRSFASGVGACSAPMSDRAAVASARRERALLPALLAIMVAGTIASPAFLTSQNLSTVVRFSATMGLLVVGESPILSFGQLDPAAVDLRRRSNARRISDGALANSLPQRGAVWTNPLRSYTCGG